MGSLFRLLYPILMTYKHLNKTLVPLLFLLLLSVSSLAATIKGTVYNDQLEPERNVLVEVNSLPAQKLLSKDGKYTFELGAAMYVITATKEGLSVTEDVEIKGEGQYIVDIFLIEGLEEEDQLWQETEENPLQGAEDVFATRTWAYMAVGVIVALLLARIIYMRKKYGSLRLFRKHIKEEAAKSVEQHKEELAKEPGYLEKALEIIRKHDGRITQKELRKEMLYLSEAKVSLIVTELEYKGKVEKIKKGRGNVIVVKS